MNETRIQGDFPTPPAYAELAHQYAVATWGPEVYESTWWDPCCGGGNLTVDCPATTELFLSTLLSEDVATVRSAQPHATVFRHDFLNDTDNELPERLRSRLKDDAPLLLILNPPFTAGTGGQAVAGDEGERSGVSDTRYISSMKKKRLGKACQSTTAQFLYRIAETTHRYQSNNVFVVLFSPATFICGSGYDAFRDLWFDTFRPRGGFCFSARRFEGVKKGWPVLCTLWEVGKAKERSVTLDLRQDPQVISGQHTFRSVPAGHRLSDWVTRPKMTAVRPPMTGALEVATPNQRMCDRMAEGGIGHLYFHANDVRHTENGCYLTSGPNPGGKGWTVTPDNFERSMVCLTGRRLVTETWLNSQEQFSIPEAIDPQWVADAVVWATFSRRNYATSLPALEYRGETYEVKNHFFWMRIKGKETVCSRWLMEHHGDLSPLGISVLHLGYNLVFTADEHRAKADPKFHLERPDAGFQQLRWGIYEGSDDHNCQSLWKVFTQSYENLTSQLQPGVYEFNFLR